MTDGDLCSQTRVTHKSYQLVGTFHNPGSALGPSQRDRAQRDNAPNEILGSLWEAAKGGGLGKKEENKINKKGGGPTPMAITKSI